MIDEKKIELIKKLQRLAERGVGGEKEGAQKKLQQLNRSGKGKKTIQGVQCTKVQAIQIGIEYEFYCETWKEERDFFFKCFVQKHKIFPTKEEMIIRPQDDVEMSDEDAMRMQMAMSAMKDKSMTQRIEG